MSYLLFLDESGHDHKTTPYEVWGGIALHARELFPFVTAVRDLELRAFGGHLAEYRSELKGSKLLDKKRFKWAAQDGLMPEEARRKHARAFLTKGLQRATPSREEFTAYGQACLEMVRGMFQLLAAHRATLFAVATPPCDMPESEPEEFLRRDHVYLFERYFYFLEQQREHGLIVADAVERGADRKFTRRMEAYFRRTQSGRYRTTWIVPAPLFVTSDLTYGVQAADLCIYCVNWGFRLPSLGMDGPVRLEIASEFGPWLNRLQFRGEGCRDGRTFHSFGIAYVAEPFTRRA